MVESYIKMSCDIERGWSSRMVTISHTAFAYFHFLIFSYFLNTFQVFLSESSQITWIANVGTRLARRSGCCTPSESCSSFFYLVAVKGEIKCVRGSRASITMYRSEKRNVHFPRSGSRFWRRCFRAPVLVSFHRWSHRLFLSPSDPVHQVDPAEFGDDRRDANILSAIRDVLHAKRVPEDLSIAKITNELLPKQWSLEKWFRKKILFLMSRRF